ncbi:hypothetical protein EZV62_013380 [Acer yangbiense]|uniref:Major facilitator superfamily (MFS) profile domain-containing protein n=1 Tax=Acer yangbiense TaxID=1000413 RepID=A0A5C7HY17_9ROSI|nr:hypothetical protein EZV62_013380 [Acer yangbiense]
MDHVVPFFMLLGTLLLWLTTIFPALSPPSCTAGGAGGSCQSATTFQLMILYASFGLISMEAGGIRASSLAFGADQVDKGDNHKNSGVLQSYISWYYVFLTISYLVALICIVYIQDHLGWKVGFGVPVVLMVLPALSFYSASPFFIKSKANTSLISGLVRVAVASYTNQHIKFSAQAMDDKYHHNKESTLLIMPSQKLRDAKKDLTPDGEASNPWSLCAVEQVEELKALIKVIPIWSTGIMISVTVNQTSIPVLQANSMDRHITPNLQIPAGSFGMFMIISLIVWLALYDRVMVPVASKIRGKPSGLGMKARMGTGLAFSVAAMASWATAESVRRRIAIEQGVTGDPEAVVNMSAMWLLPQYILSGFGEAFNAIGQNEFFYTEFPKTMSSIVASLHGVGVVCVNPSDNKAYGPCKRDATKVVPVKEEDC